MFALSRFITSKYREHVGECGDDVNEMVGQNSRLAIRLAINNVSETGSWEILGLLHKIGDGRRHTARAFGPWRSHRRGEIFMTAISRHGDTHRHLATCINLWRHPSPYGDTFPDLATGVAKARQLRELDHILHSVSTGMYAIQEMAGWRNKKGKSGSVATLSSSKMAERASTGGSRSLPVSQTEEAVALPRCYLCWSVALW